jgi:DNA-binding MarR family transcriptional regulator
LVFHSLLRTWGLLRQVQEPYFGRFGISGAHWAVLRVLQRARLQGEEKLPLKTVAERLFIRPPSVTGVVDRLERQGLVRRVDSRVDRRVRHLGLTARGEQLLAEVLRGHARRIESLFEPLSPRERATLLALTRKLEAHLGSLPAVAAEAAGGGDGAGRRGGGQRQKHE